jgi:hypothetical protein
MTSCCVETAVWLSKKQGDGMEEKDIFQQIDEVFEDVVTVFTIEVGGESFKITSMAEIPTEKMMEFFVGPTDVHLKFKDMLNLIAMCLINPEDIVRIKQMKMKRMMEFVSRWVEQSSDASMGDGEEID